MTEPEEPPFPEDDETLDAPGAGPVETAPGEDPLAAMELVEVVESLEVVESAESVEIVQTAAAPEPARIDEALEPLDDEDDADDGDDGDDDEGDDDDDDDDEVDDADSDDDDSEDDTVDAVVAPPLRPTAEAVTGAVRPPPAARAARPDLIDRREPLYRDCKGYRLRLDPPDLARLRELAGSRGKSDAELGEAFFDGQAERLASAIADDVPSPCEVRVVVDPYSRQAFLALENQIRGILSF